MSQGNGKRGWKSWLPLILVFVIISCSGMSLLVTGFFDFVIQMADRRWRSIEQPFNKAMEHVERGEFDQAIVLFTNEIEHNTATANACLMQRGRVYRQLGRYAEALADFDERLRREPNNAVAYRARAATFGEMGRLDDAIADCDRALRLDPEQADVLALRGDIRRRKGETDAAVADYTEAIRLRPNVVSHRTGRARVYFGQKRYPEGMADLKEALRLDDDDPDALIDAAWWLAVCPDGSVRDGAKAVEYAKKACELLRWQDADALNALAAAFAEKGDFGQAVHWQRQVLVLPGVDDAQREEYDRRIKRFENRLPYRQE